MDVNPTNRQCPSCGKSFRCGSDDGDCWCGRLPRLIEVPAASGDGNTASCECPDCLARTIGKRIDRHLDRIPHDEALMLARQQAAYGQAIEHIDYTVENHQWIFTRWFLLKRGYCCGEGCRNCPYPPA